VPKAMLLAAHASKHIWRLGHAQTPIAAAKREKKPCCAVLARFTFFPEILLCMCQRHAHMSAVHKEWHKFSLQLLENGMHIFQTPFGDELRTLPNRLNTRLLFQRRETKLHVTRRVMLAPTFKQHNAYTRQCLRIQAVSCPRHMISTHLEVHNNTQGVHICAPTTLPGPRCVGEAIARLYDSVETSSGVVNAGIKNEIQDHMQQIAILAWTTHKVTLCANS